MSFPFFISNLTGSSIECDCKFYQSWKILKEKGIKIRGRCSDSSVQLSRTAFQDLNKQSFAYCGKISFSFFLSWFYSSSTFHLSLIILSLIDKSTSLVLSSETKQSSSTIINTLISSSVTSENTPPANRENVRVKATKSSQLTDVVKTSSIVVHAMTSSQATMKTTQAVVTTSKVGVTSSKDVVTSSEGVVTSSQAPVTSFQAVVTSSQAMPVVVPDQQRSSSRVGVSSSGPVGVGLAPTPSSSTAKPAEVATTTALPVKESSTSDVSPSASSVQPTFSSVAATTPPVTPLGKRQYSSFTSCCNLLGPVVQSLIKLILDFYYLFTAKGGFATKLWLNKVINYKFLFRNP